MRDVRRIAVLIALMAVAVLVVAACSSAPQTVEVTRVVPQEVPVTVVVEVTREVPVTVVVEATPAPTTGGETTQPSQLMSLAIEQQWAASAHADASAEAFIHWDEDDPAVVPTSCAKCHSSTGYRDYLGDDGSAAGAVDATVPVGEVVQCVACHNDTTATKTSVVFPSGIELTGLGAEARCMECHQGRASKTTVDAAITRANATDLDTPVAELGFVNIHYLAAGATLYGNLAQGGYQYEGKSYDGKFTHVAGYNTCIGCHNPHSLELKLNECATCHTGVTTVEDLQNIRMAGSLSDYDGDGDVSEGIAAEIAGLQATLYQVIQAYGTEVAGTAIAYESHTHPYFFIDTDGNGTADEAEVNSDNRYNAWTARLEKAAFNYQTSLKDPGAYAHNAKYIIQLLYDAIEDLNAGLAEPIDATALNRTDPGHFDGTAEAFRHWDEDGAVPGSCAKCHSGTGLPTYLKEGANISAAPTNGLQCTTCHDSLSEFTRYTVEDVTFPSGATLTTGDSDSNLCLNCHQGRESTTSVNRLTAGIEPNDTSDKLRFLNVHYFAAGATLFGGEAMGGYQYEGKEYTGRFAHVPNFDTCIECHSTHGLQVKVDMCAGCHPSASGEEGLQTIRMSTTDYDGDGDTAEGIAEEIATMQDALYAAMQAYATDVAGAGITYSSASYPYYFADTNGNGTLDTDEAVSSNSFKSWTPRLLRAAYNYQYSVKDPGDFAHNGKYTLQLLYDALEDLGNDVDVDLTGMTRP